MGQGLPPVPPFLLRAMLFVWVRPIHLFEDDVGDGEGGDGGEDHGGDDGGP